MLYLCCISSSSHNCLTTITWLHRYEPISLVCLFLFILIILIPLFNLYFFLLYLFSIVFFVLTSSVNLFFLISLSVVAPIFLLNSLYSISMLLYLSLDPNTNSSKIFCYVKVSKLSITKLQNSPQFWWLCSLWLFNQFRVLLCLIALKVVGPCFLTQIL